MEELNRKKKVLDMMISMHSMLRDRYRGWSFTTDVVLLLSAAGLNTLIFVDQDYVTDYLGEFQKFNLAVGVFSILTFLLSLVVLLVKWKEKAEQHHNASNELTRLLNSCRDLLSEQTITSEVIKSFTSKYDDLCAEIEPIPQGQFNRLKAKYLRKKSFSKFIEQNGAMPYWLASAKFQLQSLKGKPGESNG